MAKIPKYDKQVSFSGELSPALSRGMNETPIRVMQEIGDIALRFGKKMEEVDKFRQETGAAVIMQSGLNELKALHNEEPDLEKKKEYWGKVQDVVNKAMGTIRSPEVMARFERTALIAGDAARFSMQREHREQTLRSAQDNLQLAELQAAELAKTPDEMGIRTGAMLYDKAVGAAEQLGLISAEEGAFRRQSINTVMRTNQLYSIAENNPEQALSLVEENVYGLEPKANAAIKAYANSIVEQRAQKQELAFINHKIETMAMLPKEVDFKMVAQLEATETLTHEQANKLRTRIMDGIMKEPVESNKAVYEQLLDRKLDLYNFDDKNKVEGTRWWKNYAKTSENYSAELFDAYANGQLTRKDYETLGDDIVKLSRDKYDGTVVSTIMAHKKLAQMAVNDNPLTAREVSLNLYREIESKVRTLGPMEAEQVAIETYNMYKGSAVGVVSDGKAAGSVVKDEKSSQGFKVGASFEGGTIRAVRPK